MAAEQDPRSTHFRALAAVLAATHSCDTNILIHANDTNKYEYLYPFVSLVPFVYWYHYLF